MGLDTIAYPLINGHRYGWSSIEIKLLGFTFRGMKSIDYDTGLDPGIVRGVGVAPTGRTRGQRESNASFECYRVEFDELVIALGGDGFGERSFTPTVQYSELGGDDPRCVTDTIEGARIKKVSFTLAEGNEPAMAKVELSVINVLLGGFSISNSLRP